MQPHTNDLFASVEGTRSVAIPDAYERRGATNVAEPFLEVVRDLEGRFGIETRSTGYKDTEDESWRRDGRYVALVNPAWLGDGIQDAPQDTALWHIASDSYTPAGPRDTYGPLAAAARVTDNREMFGSFVTYRNGGEWAVDTFFKGITAGEGEVTDRFILGFESGANYFGSASLWAQVIALDTETGAVMRGLSDKFTTPHRGDAIDRMVDWFEGMLERIEKVGDTLYGIVAEARSTEIDIRSYPGGIADWYEAIGIPGSIGREAANHVRINGSNPTAWELYIALANTLTDDYEGKRGGALLDHAATANEILFSPARVERRALKHLRTKHVTQGTLSDDDRRMVDYLDDQIEDLDDAVNATTDARQKIRDVLSQLDESAETETA